MTDPIPSEIENALGRFSAAQSDCLLKLRAIVLEVADELEVGPLTETLKWGEPAYLTEASKSGTTIRLGAPKHSETHCAILVHCQTTLVSEFRETIDDPRISFEGNRAVIFDASQPLPDDALRHCIAQALTYKRR